MSPQLAAALRSEEFAQLERLLRRNQARIESDKEAHYGRLLPAAIAYATRWSLDPQNHNSGLAALACDTREALSKLLAAMVSVGVGRERQRASSKPTRSGRTARAADGE